MTSGILKLGTGISAFLNMETTRIGFLKIVIQNG
jgi:hypothetical protein